MDQGAAATGESIEKGGLADVGPAHHHDNGLFAHCGFSAGASFRLCDWGLLFKIRSSDDDPPALDEAQLEKGSLDRVFEMALFHSVGGAVAGDVPHLDQPDGGVDAPEHAHGLDIETDELGVDPVAGVLEQLLEQLVDGRDLVGARMALQGPGVERRVGLGQGGEVAADSLLDGLRLFGAGIGVFAGRDHQQPQGQGEHEHATHHRHERLLSTVQSRG